MSIKRVGIVGSGIMGSGIAEVVARSHFELVVRSRHPDTRRALLVKLEHALSRRSRIGTLTKAEQVEALDRIRVTDRLRDLSSCDLVIEAVIEDLSIKKELFRELGRICSEDTILATNTSSLPVVEMAMQTGTPGRVCGLHFFNPAPTTALVEVVRAITTADETVSAAMAFAKACQKRPVSVMDRSGFIVNALLFPYLNGAVQLLEAGVASRESIDQAMKDGCGHPIGPLALLDLIGLDTSVAILDALYAESRDPNHAPRPLLRRMVSAGQLGRKSGYGFFGYAAEGMA